MTYRKGKEIFRGESKIFYSVEGRNDLAMVELIPSLYSFTHNRYGAAPGTDSLRVKFWKLFASEINIHHKGMTSYVDTVCIEGKFYTVVEFVESLPPIEVVWKNYMVGTMKHTLFDVDKHLTKNRYPIKYETKFPSPIIRFDWRNKHPEKDEAIPDEFANFYTDVVKAKITVKNVTDVIRTVLARGGYELIDLCYFINYEGTKICSEITPDGMRIRKKGNSFDKDLWRQGKDTETIIKIWTELYEDIKW